jgi:1-deoxy-D-xylulose-5-phosphate reductoisomerase
VLAQLGNPDMRTAIAHALAWPARIEAGVAPLDLAACAPLTFQQPDLATFRCLALAFQALRAGGDATAILNAANEVAVEAFLGGKIPFLRIVPVVVETRSAFGSRRAPASVEEARAIDAEARAVAGERVTRLAGMRA